MQRSFKTVSGEEQNADFLILFLLNNILTYFKFMNVLKTACKTVGSDSLNSVVFDQFKLELERQKFLNLNLISKKAN